MINQYMGVAPSTFQVVYKICQDTKLWMQTVPKGLLLHTHTSYPRGIKPCVAEKKHQIFQSIEHWFLQNKNHRTTVLLNFAFYPWGDRSSGPITLCLRSPIWWHLRAQLSLLHLASSICNHWDAPLNSHKSSGRNWIVCPIHRCKL